MHAAKNSYLFQNYLFVFSWIDNFLSSETLSLLQVQDPSQDTDFLYLEIRIRHWLRTNREGILIFEVNW